MCLLWYIQCVLSQSVSIWPKNAKLNYVVKTVVGDGFWQESRCKGSTAPAVKSPVVDEERMRPGTGYGECFVFPSVLWHWWLGDRRTSGPYRPHFTNPQRFSSRTGGDGGPEGELTDTLNRSSSSGIMENGYHCICAYIFVALACMTGSRKFEAVARSSHSLCSTRQLG